MNYNPQQPRTESGQFSTTARSEPDVQLEASPEFPPPPAGFWPLSFNTEEHDENSYYGFTVPHYISPTVDADGVPIQYWDEEGYPLPLMNADGYVIDTDCVHGPDTGRDDPDGSAWINAHNAEGTFKFPPEAVTGRQLALFWAKVAVPEKQLENLQLIYSLRREVEVGEFNAGFVARNPVTRRTDQAARDAKYYQEFESLGPSAVMAADARSVSRATLLMHSLNDNHAAMPDMRAYAYALRFPMQGVPGGMTAPEIIEKYRTMDFDVAGWNMDNLAEEVQREQQDALDRQYDIQQAAMEAAATKRKGWRRFL